MYQRHQTSCNYPCCFSYEICLARWFKIHYFLLNIVSTRPSDVIFISWTYHIFCCILQACLCWAWNTPRGSLLQALFCFCWPWALTIMGANLWTCYAWYFWGRFMRFQSFLKLGTANMLGLTHIRQCVPILSNILIMSGGVPGFQSDSLDAWRRSWLINVVSIEWYSGSAYDMVY